MDKIGKFQVFFLAFAITSLLLSAVLYTTYAYDTSVSTEDDDTYDGKLVFNLTSSTSDTSKSIAVDTGDINVIKVKINNNNDFKVQYLVSTDTQNSNNSANTTGYGIYTLNTSDNQTTGTIEASSSIYIDLVIVNKTTATKTFTITVNSGYVGKNISPSTGYSIDDIYSFPNPPNLTEGMIPVVYNSSTNKWIKADVSNLDSTYYWYEYSIGKWANMVLVTSQNRSPYEQADVGTTISDDDILGHFVWIPRYKYKVWNIEKQAGTDTYDAQNTGIEIIFENNTETTGTITCTYDTSITPVNDGQLSEVCYGNNDEYYTHPAFTFGTSELTGFWTAKFETTGSSSEPTILPNKSPVNDLSISSLFNVSKLIKSNTTYGLNSTDVDSHMIRNTEWGAVAYLSHSANGLCLNNSCSEIGTNNYVNSDSYLTGCGATASSEASTTCNVYNSSNGLLASTTQNIYGIYDMSGGTNEYTMGVMYSDPSGSVSQAAAGSSNSGFNGPAADGYSSYTSGTDYPASKYYDSYSYDADQYGSPKAFNRSRLGDATGEVNITTNNAWNSDFSVFLGMYLGVDYTFFRRGGDANNGANAGIFSYYSSAGNAQPFNSFRIALS